MYKVQVGFPHVVSSTIKLEIKGIKPTALYIVDGRSFFGLATDLTRFMQWGGDTPCIFVVAIRYLPETPAFIENARREDLTPTRTAYRATPVPPGKTPSSILLAPEASRTSPDPYEQHPKAFNNVWTEFLPDEDHHTVQAISMSRGPRFLLTDKVATQPLG